MCSHKWVTHFLQGFDVARSLNLMPKFKEDELDTFFTLVERLSKLMGWKDSERTLLLQCVFQDEYLLLPVLKKLYRSSLHLAYTLIL